MADNKAPEPVVAPAPTVAPSQGPATATPPAPAPAAAAEPAAFSSPETAPATESAVSLPAADAPAAEVDPLPISQQEQPTTEAPKANDSSILGDLTKPEEVKAEEKPAAEAPKAEEPAIVLPTYEKFTLPEGVTLQDEKVGEFTKLLGEFETSSKADHAATQAFGQKMVDLYTKEAAELSERVSKNQVDVWNRTREGWKENFRKDREIGGNRQQTTLKQCKAVLDRYKSSAGDDRYAALTQTFSLTGAGDHPAMIHFINWSSQFATERARPVAAVVPKSPNPNSRAQRRYAGSNGD